MLFILATMLGLVIAFFLSWGAYHLGAKFMLFEGVSPTESMSLAGLEIFYVAVAMMFAFFPLGGIISSLMYLALPFVMIKAIKTHYETGLPASIIIYVMASVAKMIVVAPLYLI